MSAARASAALVESLSDTSIRALFVSSSAVEPTATAATLCMQALAARPGIDVVYGDETRIDSNGSACPYLRPGWSEDHFLSAFDLGDVLAIRADAVRRAAATTLDGGPEPLFRLVLAASERPGACLRLPRSLARRMMVPGAEESRSASRDAERRVAVGAQLAARAGSASIDQGLVPGSWRVRRALPAELLVTVAIPTRGAPELVERCVASLRVAARRPPAIEIVIVDNDSRDDATLRLLLRLERDGDVRAIRHPGRFNFSAMANRAAREGRGDLLLLLNNDTVVLDPDTMTALAEEAIRPEVAAAGARLVYPDGRIQHAGLVLGMGVVAGHLYKGLHAAGPAHFVSPLVAREVAAVDGACFMTRRATFLELGGFDEVQLPVSFADVDFCLRARRHGFRIRYTPHAHLMHDETRTRDPELDPREIAVMERRWGAALSNDPHYHPGLTLDSESARPDPARCARLAHYAMLPP